jgi:ATP-dependent Clp protease ATP-binding subunit ClpA
MCSVRHARRDDFVDGRGIVDAAGMAQVQPHLRGLPADQQALRGSLMNGYHFTEPVRKVLVMAREEAERLHHGYVGPEHLLLALLRESDGVAATVIANLTVDGEDLETRLAAMLGPGFPRASRGPDLPYTSRGKKVLELTMSEARQFDHAYVGTEHLLLGLLREEKSVAANALAAAGITIDSARAETLRILGEVDGPRSASSQRWSGLQTILSAAISIANQHGGAIGAADLLEAIVFSSRDIAAAFATREVDVPGLIEEIRGLSDRG